MNGSKLKMLLTINGIRTYEVANELKCSHTTMTRWCQPNRELEDSVVCDVLKTARSLKGEPLVTGVDFSKDIPKNLERSIKVC
jgi:hypothetical protein